MVKTRPDIMFARLITSYFIKNPGPHNMKAIKTIFKYFIRFRKQGIKYGGLTQEQFFIKGYSDSD